MFKVIFHYIWPLYALNALNHQMVKLMRPKLRYDDFHILSKLTKTKMVYIFKKIKQVLIGSGSQKTCHLF